MKVGPVVGFNDGLNVGFLVVGLIVGLIVGTAVGMAETMKKLKLIHHDIFNINVNILRRQ
jgi:hypothetical protein